MHEYGRKLVFLGGTCLRPIHNNDRFSEVLEFDNLSMDKDQFRDLSDAVKLGLEREGFQVEIDIRSRTAYRCKVRFPSLLYKHGLIGHIEQRVLIQLDTESQKYDYTPLFERLDKFYVNMAIPCCPLEHLLAQKCHTILDRPRNKGRDFYDVVFLLNWFGIEPDPGYMKKRIRVDSTTELAQRLLAHCTGLEMNEQAADARPFLFRREDADTVIEFPKIIENR